MKRTIFSLLFAILTITASAQAGTITVTVDNSQQAIIGLTNIDFAFTGLETSTYTLIVTVSFDNGVNYEPIDLNYLIGNISAVSGNGTSFSGSLVWDGKNNFPNRYHEQTKIRITATPNIFQCGDPITFTYRGSAVTYGTVLVDYGEIIGEKCWMDRNLGASQVATSSTDEAAYGDLFQWGRLDDGHQDRASLETSTLSAEDDPEHGDYIKTNTWPYDWRTSQNNNLWQPESGTNNPCPPGWRVPTMEELDNERNSWDSTRPDGAFLSALKWPMAGYRYFSSGPPLQYVGERGHYWSSTPGDHTFPQKSRFLNFYIRQGDIYFPGDGGLDSGLYHGDRASGLSVRCIKN